MKKKQIVAIVLFVLLIAAFALVWILGRPAASEGSKNLTVTVQHLDGSEKNFAVKTDAEYLRGALEPEGIIAGSDGEYGLWIQTVDGETADDSLQQWWGFTVNGEFAMYGADEQVVNDGDVIVFTLNEGY